MIIKLKQTNKQKTKPKHPIATFDKWVKWAKKNTPSVIF